MQNLNPCTDCHKIYHSWLRPRWRTLVPSLVKIRLRGTSGQIGEMSLSLWLYFFFLRQAQRSNPLTDFDAWWLKMRGITQGFALWGLKCLILTFDHYLPQKCQTLPPKYQFQSKMMKYESPIISETTKPMDLKIWYNMMTSQQIQYGGRPPYWKSSFGYISTNNKPINAKLCRIKQNRVLT